jgi:hypothetical protein
VTATDWVAGVFATAFVWAAVIRKLRITQTRRNRRELRRSAERAAGS